MPTRNVSLTERHDRFIAEAMEDGHYQNASEVVREGLRLLEQRAGNEALKVARLRSAIAEGEADIAAGHFEEVELDHVEDWLDRISAPLSQRAA